MTIQSQSPLSSLASSPSLSPSSASSVSSASASPPSSSTVQTASNATYNSRIIAAGGSNSHTANASAAIPIGAGLLSSSLTNNGANTTGLYDYFGQHSSVSNSFINSSGILNNNASNASFKSLPIGSLASAGNTGAVGGLVGYGNSFSNNTTSSNNNQDSTTFGVNNISSINNTNKTNINVVAKTSNASLLSNSIHSLSNAAPNMTSALSSGINGTHSTNGLNASVSDEDVATLFLVGFPEDMQEREFQAMFTFCPGFEAATLKIPQKDQQEDDALTLGVNGVNPRKQTIGFAKFRTHNEALAARDVLNGRIVDSDKGSLLKAELAKKNLHTRRGLSVELQAPIGTSAAQSAILAPTPTTASFPTTNAVHAVNITQKSIPQQLHHRSSLANTAAYDAFHSVPCSPALPSDLLSPNDYPSSYDFYADVYAPNGSHSSTLGFVESFGGRHQPQPTPDLSSSFLGRQSLYDNSRIESLSNGTANLASSISNSYSNSISNSFSNGSMLGGIHMGSFSNSNSNSNNLNSAPNSGMNNGNTNNRHVGFAIPRFHKGFLESETELPSTSMGYLSKSTPAHTERGFNNGMFPADEAARFQGLSISTAAAAALVSPSLPSPGLPSPGFRTPTNPSDQNPPCNTLYVGNLPMNTSEDELRALFSRCLGYRRLCFRTKSNGPMCFVEFENVECATQALNDLYGNPLSNSVKGGIRLSFSKNPLGVRNPAQSSLSSLGTQIHNMNLNAMNAGNMNGPFLDRRDSMSALFDQPY